MLIAQDLKNRTSVHDVLGLKLRHLHFVYALALVSSINNHAVDFNWQIWDDPVDCLKVSKSLAFRKYDIGSMGEFLGQVWILANETALDIPTGEPARSVRPGRIDSFAEQELAGVDLPFLAENFAKQDLVEPTSKITEAESSAMEISRGHSNEPTGPSVAFQISVSISQLWALWHANINFAEKEDRSINRENTESETTQEKPGLRIGSLGVGEGVILPIDNPAPGNSALSKEVVCKWYSLGADGDGNVRTMADIAGDEDISGVVFYHFDMLLII